MLSDRCYLTAELLLLLSCPVLAAAVQPISSAAAEPPAIAIRTPESVVFTAIVGKDPALISTSVNVVRTDVVPSVVASLMYDDGTHGDAVAGDGVFTTTMALNVSQVGQLSFVVSAAYRGALQRVTSSPVSIVAFVPPAVAELGNYTVLESTALQLYQSRLSNSDAATAKAAAIAYLSSKPNVASARLSGDGNTITIQYTGKITSYLFVGPANTNSGGHRRRRRQFPKSMTSLAPAILVSPALTTENALLLSPYYAQFASLSPSGDFVDDISSSLADVGIPASILKNENVTVETFKNLSQYSLIALTTHGGNDDQTTSVSSGEIYTVAKANTQPYQAYLNLGWIGPCTPAWPAGAQPRFCITSTFIQHYAQVSKVAPNGFPGSIVFISACDGFVLTDLERAFLNSGAATFLAWNATVYTPFAASEIKAFFNLLTTQVNGFYPTTQSAYDAMPFKVDTLGGESAKLVILHRAIADRSLNIWSSQPPLLETITSTTGSQLKDGVDQMTSTFSPVFSFVLTQNITNLSVSVSVGGSGTGHAYLTSTVGPGAAPSSVISAVNFVAPTLPYSFNGSNITLFSGMSLPAGTYYVTFFCSSGNVVIETGSQPSGSAAVQISPVAYSTVVPLFPASAAYTHQGAAGTDYYPIMTITGELSANTPAVFDNLTSVPLSADNTCLDDTNSSTSAFAPCLFYYQQFDNGFGYPLPASGPITSLTVNVGVVEVSYQPNADNIPVNLRIDGSSTGAHYSISSNVTYAELHANARNGHWSTITFQFAVNDTVNLAAEKLAVIYSMYSNNGYGIDLTFQETATNPFPATNGVGNYCTIYGCGGLDNGHSIAFALNYKAPGKIAAKATLDGKPWSGGLSFSLTGPTTYSASQLPAATGSLVTGSYQVSYLAGGPPGAILGGIAPCGNIGTAPMCVVGLNSDVPLMVVFQFKTSAAAPIYDNLTNVPLSADTTCIDDTNGHQSPFAPCLFYSEVFAGGDNYSLPITGVISSITLNVGLVEASWVDAAANSAVGIRIDGAFSGAHYSASSNVTYAQLRANAQSGRWTSITFQFSPSDTVDLSSDKLAVIFSMYSNNGAGIDLTFQETASDSILPSTNGNWVASYCSFFGCGTPDSAHDLAFAIR